MATIFPRTMSRATFQTIGMVVAAQGVLAALLAPLASEPSISTALYAVACASLVMALIFAAVLWAHQR